MAVEIANVIHAMAVIELSNPPRFLANYGFTGATHDDTGQFSLDLQEKLALTLDKADAVISVQSMSTPPVTYTASILAGGDHKGGIFIEVLKAADQTPIDGNFAQVIVFRCPSP